MSEWKKDATELLEELQCYIPDHAKSYADLILLLRNGIRPLNPSQSEDYQMARYQLLREQNDFLISILSTILYLPTMRKECKDTLNKIREFVDVQYKPFQ